MENGGNMYFNCNRGQNGNSSNSNLALGDVWEFNNSRFDWNNSNTLYSTTNSAAASAASTSGTTINTCPGGSSVNELMLHHHGSAAADHHHHHHHHHHRQQSLYAGDGSHVHPDPHLMCLKLGKRHYFEDATALGDRHVDACSIGKRGKVYYYSGGGGGECASSSSASVRLLPAAVPRCQVEGCHVALVNAKDYHRRHKVCEMHSKAPKVVVLGLEQRFCQQCSRFHAVSEFDDSKRSCRRRLAGHNERRRKSSHDSIPRNSSQDNRLMAGRLPYLSLPAGCALSLLSSRTDYWVSPADLSSRSSAALRELIAEHRATILARQLILDRDMHMRHHAMEDITDAPTGSVSFAPHRHQALPEAHGWDRFHDGGVQVTLDLMQAPSSAFGLLPVRGRTKEEENECCELWNSLEGAHVV